MILSNSNRNPQPGPHDTWWLYLPDFHPDDLPVAVAVPVHHVQQEGVFLLREHFALFTHKTDCRPQRGGVWVRKKLRTYKGDKHRRHPQQDIRHKTPPTLSLFVVFSSIVTCLRKERKKRETI